APVTPLAPATTSPSRATPPGEIAAPAPSPEAPVVAVEEHAPPAAESSGRRLWVWAAIGAAVAGGVVGAFFVLRSPGATPPATELGNYKF
ncbi:MAG TPA: hypothetical protein VHO67_02440, partial [Polyangia bacterium]|nr:hypothetical protein [Polyangia bacterium]